MKTICILVVLAAVAAFGWRIYTEPRTQDRGGAGLVITQKSGQPEAPSESAKAAAEEKRIREAESGAATQVDSNRSISLDSDVPKTMVPASIARVPSGRKTGTVMAEQRILKPGGVFDGAALSSTMNSGQFPKFVDALKSQSGSSPLASDINQMYGDAISEQVGKLGNELQLRDFACGETVCAGTIDSMSREAWDAWIRDNASDPRTKAYVFTEHQIDNGNGSTEHRFIFSTDPDSRTISVTGQ